jgi:hypothetical protein
MTMNKYQGTSGKGTKYTRTRYQYKTEETSMAKKHWSADHKPICGGSLAVLDEMLKKAGSK